jgi:hypothetical protein
VDADEPQKLTLAVAGGALVPGDWGGGGVYTRAGGKGQGKGEGGWGSCVDGGLG